MPLRPFAMESRRHRSERSRRPLRVVILLPWRADELYFHHSSESLLKTRTQESEDRRASATARKNFPTKIAGGTSDEKEWRSPECWLDFFSAPFFHATTPLPHRSLLLSFLWNSLIPTSVTATTSTSTSTSIARRRTPEATGSLVGARRLTR